MFWYIIKINIDERFACNHYICGQSLGQMFNNYEEFFDHNLTYSTFYHK